MFQTSQVNYCFIAFICFVCLFGKISIIHYQFLLCKRQKVHKSTVLEEKIKLTSRLVPHWQCHCTTSQHEGNHFPVTNIAIFWSVSNLVEFYNTFLASKPKHPQECIVVMLIVVATNQMIKMSRPAMSRWQDQRSEPWRLAGSGGVDAAPAFWRIPPTVQW